MDELLLRGIALELNRNLSDPLTLLRYLERMAPGNIIPVVQAFDRYAIEFKEIQFCIVLTELSMIFGDDSIGQLEKNDMIQSVGLFLEHYMKLHAATINTIRSALMERERDGSIIPMTDISLSDPAFSKPQQWAMQMHQTLDSPRDFWVYINNSDRWINTLVAAFDMYAIPNKESRFHLAVNAIPGIMAIDGHPLDKRALIRSFAMFVKYYMVYRKRMLARIRAQLLLRDSCTADVVPTLMRLK